MSEDFGIGFLLADGIEFFDAGSAQNRALFHVIDIAVGEGVGIGALKCQHDLRHGMRIALVARGDTPESVPLND